MALNVEEIKKKLHIRDTDFFLKNYRGFSEDIDRGRINEIVDVELECLGYGVFNPTQLLNNFMAYFLDMIRVMRGGSIHTLKIMISGFNLDPNDPILQKIAKEIPLIKDNLAILWIRTSNLKNVSIKDFNDLLRLSHHLSDINFEDFVLECSNWSFNPSQPTFKDLKKIFESLISDSADITKILNKHWRLEMSGWYYTAAEAKAFLGFKPTADELKKIPENQKSRFSAGNEYNDELFFKELEIFFKNMEKLLDELLNVMDNIEFLELDMRNSNPFLKLSNLKKRLDNCSKANRTEKSLISKRYEVQQDNNEKELRLNIMM